MSPDGNLVEIMERNDHPWFIGVQFHPELKSTPFKPHPIFNSYIKALFEKLSVMKKLELEIIFLCQIIVKLNLFSVLVK